MVSTRRAAAAASEQPAQPQPDQDLPNSPVPVQVLKSQRAPRRKAPSQVAGAVAKRRTRSAKDAVSPLQALKSPPKPKRKRTRPTTPVPVQVEDGIMEAEDGSPEFDPGAGIFFQIHSQPAEGSPNRPLADSPIDQEPRFEEPQFDEPLAPTLEGSERALALLERIENNAKPARRAQPLVDRTKASPKSPEVVNHTTSPVETPQQQSLFGKMLSVFMSPFSSSSSHATPSSVRPQQPVTTNQITSPTSSPTVNELTLALTPTPTPVGERRIKSKTKRTKNHRKAMVKTIANSVRDPAEQEKAEAWAQEVLAKLPKGSAILGDKRKRLENGVKVGDLKHIQGTKPWKSGSYGLDDDIFDLSDSEDAPAWAVLQDMLLQELEDNEPPTKKRKAAHDSDMDDITPLNDTIISMSSGSPSGIFNTKGNSASLDDLRPRSSRIPSPMFESTPTHQKDGNVFIELDEQSPVQQSSAERRADFKRELRRTGHVAGSGSFCVPEDDSDEDESMDEGSIGEASPLWTQQPPPAPVPAHASLPTPLGESSSAPATALDPIEFQRARITKHTPAKPSRLREVHVPSPSLRSDAGNESMMQSSIVASPMHTKGQATEMRYGIPLIPDAEPLDIPPEHLECLDNFIHSEDGQAFFANCNWDDPIVSFSDVDEEDSE